MAEQDEALDLEELAPSDRPLSVPDEIPILPLRDTVLFPNSFMPLAVARESSVRLIDEAISAGKLIGVFTQRDASVEEPLKDDLQAFLRSSQTFVSGTVTLETAGGTVTPVAIRSEHILRNKGAVYAQSADWDAREAEGFIKLLGMSSTLSARVNPRRRPGQR